MRYTITLLEEVRERINDVQYAREKIDISKTVLFGGHIDQHDHLDDAEILIDEAIRRLESHCSQIENLTNQN